MQVVDPHVHFWNLDTHRYPWLAQRRELFIGPYDALARNHEPADFLSGAGDIDVLKVVHVDAGHDPADPVEETRWLQAMADHPGSRGFPNGIVAACDLGRPDAERILAAHRQYRNLRGIRQILNVHPDPRLDYVGRHYMREPAWQEGFRLLRRFGLSFDLQIYPSQMIEAAALARANPETMLILNHAGMFADRDRVEGWRIWRDGIAALAACPNVAVKISGMGMLDHKWTVESIRPYALEIIDRFGAERAMFASNFPVDRLYSDYATLWHAYEAVVAGASDAERARLFRENAARIYRLGKKDGQNEKSSSTRDA